MNVLIVDDDNIRRARQVARARALWPNALIREAISAEGARRDAAGVLPDALFLELAIPEEDGGPVSPHQQRVTLDHRLVGADFPGTRLVRDLHREIPGLRVFVRTWLAPDHADVMDMRSLGAEQITHKGLPFDVPVQHEPRRLMRID